MTEEELEAARRKYMGKLVRIMENEDPLDEEYAVGVVTRVVDSNIGGAVTLTLQQANGNTENWYVNAHGYTAEIYTH